MKRSTTVLDTEPVAALLGSIVVTIDAALVAGTALGWIDLTPDQAAALVAFVTAVSGAIGAALRARVWAPASVDELTRPSQPKEV